MKKLIILCCLFISSYTLYPQDIILTFNPIDQATTIDSIKVTNVETGNSVTVINEQNVNLTELFTSTQNLAVNNNRLFVYPNPFDAFTTVEYSTDEYEKVQVALINSLGQIVALNSEELYPGNHTFKVYDESPGIYYISIISHKGTYSSKLACTGHGGAVNKIQYVSNAEHANTKVKSTLIESGDLIHVELSSGSMTTIIADRPTESTTYDVEFFECVDGDGTNYPIVQIGEQWWMAKDLKYDPGSDYYTIFFFNEPYGYHYDQEAAAMNCPEGWHLPSNDEWQQLAQFISNDNGGYEYINGDIMGTWSEVGKHLKNVVTNPSLPGTWEINNGTDDYGFSALPGGYIESDQYRNVYGYFDCTQAGYWWTSEYVPSPNARFVSINEDNEFYWGTSSRYFAYNVRYVMDTAFTPPSVTTSAVFDIYATTASCGGNVTSDGGKEVTARGVCWNTTGNPTILDGITNDGTGTGSFSSTLESLTTNTTYYLRAYATNSAGTAYGNQVEFITKDNSNTFDTSTLTDPRNGHTYKTVKIGEQWWMAEDLKYDPGAEHTIFFVNEPYGYHYDWEAALMNCPEGWHLPSNDEWQQLAQFISNDNGGYEYFDGNTMGTWSEVGKHLKNVVTNPSLPGTWEINNGTDDYGFSAWPGGYIDSDVDPTSFEYFDRTLAGYWWTSDYFAVQDVRFVSINEDNEFYWGSSSRYFGYNVRYVKNSETDISETPSVETSAIYDITWTTALSGGYVTFDGGEEVTARGVCWNTTGSPTISDNTSSDGTGTGNFSSTLEGLTANTTYYVRAYATNSVGTAYGNQVEFETDGITVETSTIIDSRDGQTYNIVKIGEQWWMAENLAYRPTEGYRRYNNDESNIETYGILYDWNMLKYGEYFNYGNGICPYGWHLPSDAEWEQLAQYVSDQMGPFEKIGTSWSNVGKFLKSTGTIEDGTGLWLADQPEVAGTDDFGFSGIPGGAFYSNNNFDGLGQYGAWWTATLNETVHTEAYYWMLSSSSTIFHRNSYITNTMYSCRCVMDAGVINPVVPTVTTSGVSNIQSNSAEGGGTVNSDGGEMITARGVCWNTTGNPTISDYTSSDGTGLGSFSSTLEGLTANTTYYVRAFAANSVGTGYGDQVEFITEEEPVISVSPTSLDFGTETTGLTFDIQNTGTGTLTWGASSDVTWATVIPESGEATTETDQVTVNVDRSGLAPGTYSGTISVSSDGGSQDIAVSIEVAEEPVLSVTPIELYFSPPNVQSTFAIENSGTGTLTWNISENISWLSLDIVSGDTTSETDLITVTVYPSGLPGGVYNGIITVTSNGGNQDIAALMLILIE